MEFTSVQRYFIAFRLNSTSAYYKASTVIIIIIIIIIIMRSNKTTFLPQFNPSFSHGVTDGRTSLSLAQSFFQADNFSEAVHHPCLNFSSIFLKFCSLIWRAIDETFQIRFVSGSV
jgi:hypothetical protein